MTESKRYPLMNLNDVYAERNMLNRIRDIVAYGIVHELSISTVMGVINNELALIEDEVDLHNKKARRNIIRRELGLDESAVITGKEYVQVFPIFTSNPPLKD